MSTVPLSRFRLILLIMMISFVTSGCSTVSSWFPDEIDETKSWSASKLYAEAKASLNEGEYKSAIELYEKLEARYPHGAYAQQAQLETAYAYYKLTNRNRLLLQPIVLLSSIHAMPMLTMPIICAVWPHSRHAKVFLNLSFLRMSPNVIPTRHYNHLIILVS